ncbi:hypothetical protein, partial [Novipirellula herctigrandis]|uniref:hypothetical protein n=1 Tax=Novipirellula herctigrandis TaxID=2527986 RepID=UPI003AF3E18C
ITLSKRDHHTRSMLYVDTIFIVTSGNGNVHRAAAKDMQAEKAARPAAPCATYCYPSFCGSLGADCTRSTMDVPSGSPPQELPVHSHILPT